jgi:flagellin
MSKIGTNQMAVNAQKAMSQIQRKMTKTMEKLSTGLRINKPNDDPAGLSISTKMTSQITGYNTAAKNINDAIAMVQTIDGALGEQINLMQRMRELAVQSVSETYTNADRTMMETEFDNLVTEIIRIGADTKWNTEAVLDETARKIQVGADSGQIITYTEPDGDVYGLTVSTISVVNSTSAAAAITQIDTDIAAANVSRATAGAFLTRFEGALDNALEMVQNVTDTRSRILDTDYAAELAELAKLQIMQQATNAMMAQANTTPQSVLAMLT